MQSQWIAVWCTESSSRRIGPGQEATLQILSSTCICDAQRALDKASNRRIPDRSPSDKVLRRHSFIAPAPSITYGKWSVVHRSRIVGIAKICSNLRPNRSTILFIRRIQSKNHAAILFIMSTIIVLIRHELRLIPVHNL